MKSSCTIPSVTMVGALPPLKGNSYYCASLTNALAKECWIEFVSFQKLYPNWLYPGGVSEAEDNSRLTFRFERIISYYNPVSWLRAAMRSRGEILHLQWWSLPTAPVYLLMIFLLRNRKKIVVTMHNVRPHENSVLALSLNRAIIRYADRVIVHSRKNVYDLAQLYSVPKHRIQLVPMAAHDNYSDSRLLGSEEARSRLGLSEMSKVILFFGNIRPYKGLKDLLRALASIRKDKELGEQIHLVVAGQCWGSWRPYQDLIDSNCLSDFVTVRRDYIPKAEVAALFVASDLVVCPYTHFDAQSGVGNIAVAFGKPLLVSRVGGLQELVDHPSAVVEPSCPDALARKILAILKNSELQETLSWQNIERAKAYSWETMAKMTREVYRDLQQ